jgi:dihydrodipicolinate synthase/N-acetylneuraminate lyase
MVYRRYQWRLCYNFDIRAWSSSWVRAIDRVLDMHGYLVSIPIPWDEWGNFLPEQFCGAIEKLRHEGCNGIYLFGTSGEGYAITDNEFARILEVFEEATEGFEGFRQVCCFGLSSDQVKDRCRMVAERGIEDVQVTLPFWKEINDEELTQFFSDVCGSFGELSFLLYNNPRNKRRLTGKELESLHHKTPNLKGAKTGAGNWFDFFELITESPSLQHFVTEPAFLYSYGLAEVGLIPSSNYALPNQCRAYYDAVVSNDLPTASELHRETVRFFQETAIPLLQKGYIDGAIDKGYARIGGMEMPLNIKSPYVALSDADFRWLESKVKAEFG